MSCKRASNSTKSDSKTASDHAAADIERTKHGPSSTQKCLSVNALHVATLTRNAKAADQKSSKLVPLKDRRQAADVTVWQTQELDGCDCVTDLDFGSVANKELDCGSVADKE